MKAFIVKTVKRLKKEASWRSSELKKICVDLIDSIGDDLNTKEGANTDEHDLEPTATVPLSFDTADPYVYVLKAALESRQSRLMDIALDVLHYLIEHDYIKGKGIVNEATQMTLMDDIIEAVCKCEDEYDEVIQLQVPT